MPREDVVAALKIELAKWTAQAEHFENSAKDHSERAANYARSASAARDVEAYYQGLIEAHALADVFDVGYNPAAPDRPHDESFDAFQETEPGEGGAENGSQVR